MKRAKNDDEEEETKNRSDVEPAREEFVSEQESAKLFLKQRKVKKRRKKYIQP